MTTKCSKAYWAYIETKVGDEREYMDLEEFWEAAWKRGQKTLRAKIREVWCQLPNSEVLQSKLKYLLGDGDED